MGYVYGTSLAALTLAVATLPILLVLAEACPRLRSRMAWAVAVWLLAVAGLTALGGVAVLSLPDGAPEGW